MQWEYKWIDFDTHHPPMIESALNSLGRQGWEAVGVALQSDTDNVRVLLKRQS